LWGITLFIQLGMWMERFVLIVGSEAQDFLTSSWHMYRPSIIDGSILFGTVCFFLFLFLAFLRYVPFIPISELQQMRRELVEEERTRLEVVAELTGGEHG
jgi:molybdopterin-containing oxidoreductase family membrane subunit